VHVGIHGYHVVDDIGRDQLFHAVYLHRSS
jgi:hypothetical protein